MKILTTIIDSFNRKITLKGEIGNYILEIKEVNKPLCLFMFNTKQKAIKEFNKYKAFKKI